MHRSSLPWKKLPRGMLVRTGEKKSRSLSGIYVQTNMIKKFRDGSRKLHSLIMQLTLVNFWVVELKIKRKLMQRFLKKSRLLHAYVDM